MKDQFNIQHRTFNTQHPLGMATQPQWLYNVECWALNVSPIRL